MPTTIQRITIEGYAYSLGSQAEDTGNATDGRGSMRTVRLPALTRINPRTSPDAEKFARRRGTRIRRMHLLWRVRLKP